MMVRILSYIVKILRTLLEQAITSKNMHHYIMLSTSSDTLSYMSAIIAHDLGIMMANLLCVCSTLHAGKLLSSSNSSEENRLKLVHASVCEKKSRIIVWDYRGG